MKLFSEKLIAPCGMNCAVCRAHLREKNPCYGCNEAEQNRPKTRVNCYLRLCNKRKGWFCFDCQEFPCEKLKHLDKRYREKYKMSEIENLLFIKEKGIGAFLLAQQKKYICKKCGGVICVHDQACSICL
jgi:hypothetical protein